MKGVKVLLVGSDKGNAIEHFYIRYLRDLNLDVRIFPANRIYQEYYHCSIRNKIICRLGMSRILNTINRTLINVVSDFKPEILWVFKGMELYPAVLKAIKKSGVKLVNYNPDNPFTFTGRGSGNKNVTKSVGLFDLYFTYSSVIEADIKRRVSVSTKILPFAYDITEELSEKCRMQEEIVKLCFIGNPDRQRVDFLEKLAKAGIQMDVFGHGWNKYLRHPNIQLFDALYKDEFWKVIHRYRVQLNLLRIHNDASHNMRTFEIPSIGGIMLAPDTADHRIYFEDGKEAFYFQSLNDCIQKVANLLSLSKQEAENIRISSFNKSKLAGYSYRDRAIYVKHCFEELLAG